MDNKIILPGVGIGPMTDKYDIKILICYVLNSINQPITRDQLNFVFQDEQLVNYFSFCDALKELIETNHISSKKVEYDEILTLKQLGIETAQKLYRNLPISLRDNVVNAAINLLVKIKLESENEVNISQYKNGYKVSCIMHDKDFDLLKFELFVPDEIQAEIIKKKFLGNPLNFYQNIIKNLIDNSIE